MNQKSASAEDIGPGKKRLRSSSPRSGEPPKKQVKISSASRRAKEPPRVPSSSVSISSSVTKSKQRKGKLSSSSVEKEEPLGSETVRRHSRSEGEESDKPSQKKKKSTNKKGNTREKAPAHSSSDTETGFKNQPKKKGRREYKGKSRLRQKVGAKSGRKTVYLPSLCKRTMASPGYVKKEGWGEVNGIGGVAP